jgi:hypothetical protein
VHDVSDHVPTEVLGGLWRELAVQPLPPSGPGRLRGEGGRVAATLAQLDADLIQTENERGRSPKTTAVS